MVQHVQILVQSNPKGREVRDQTSAKIRNAQHKERRNRTRGHSDMAKRDMSARESRRSPVPEHQHG